MINDLHNQTLFTEVDDIPASKDYRFSLGKPSQVGARNILWDKIKAWVNGKLSLSSATEQTIESDIKLNGVFKFGDNIEFLQLYSDSLSTQYVMGITYDCNIEITFIDDTNKPNTIKVMVDSTTQTVSELFKKINITIGFTKASGADLDIYYDAIDGVIIESSTINITFIKSLIRKI